LPNSLSSYYFIDKYFFYAGCADDLLCRRNAGIPFETLPLFALLTDLPHLFSVEVSVCSKIVAKVLQFYHICLTLRPFFTQNIVKCAKM
jgi:hypothetical protein